MADETGNNGSELRWSSDDFDRENGELSRMPLAELEELFTEAGAELVEWGMCDNQSDIHCCLRCGFWQIKDELEMRLSWDEEFELS